MFAIYALCVKGSLPQKESDKFMTTMYEIQKGVETRATSKSALQARATQIRSRGYKARVVKDGKEYKLFVTAGMLRAAGKSTAGRATRKFS